MVRCLNLLERPTSGTVKVNGKNLTELSEKELRKERQKIGMIFQHFNLLMQRTALDNVCFPMEIAGIGKAEARKKALEYLRIVGLEEKALSYPSQLSGGQKQRVAIAEYWQVIRRSFSVMRRPVHWILRQPRQSWN